MTSLLIGILEYNTRVVFEADFNGCYRMLRRNGGEKTDK